MDYENLLQKYPTSSYSKTQRSSSVNQYSQKQDNFQQIKPQALLKKLEEILQLRQQQFNQEKQKKKKINQHKGNYTERISEKKNVQKLLENQRWKGDLQNFVTEKKERKSAYPNLISLQPSSQNLFDLFSSDSSRNPTITARSKKCESSPKKGRANSIMEGFNLSEREKGTLIKLNQQLQIQNNHLNEQLRFEQSQNTKLSLQIISMNDQITLLTKVIKRELETDRMQRQGKR
ncbi:unnamed protein product [Paramecium sonneborni]|uniref:Uncharacterized protein n=1 Tax=Paramecium sonneborni TaxID=65129 RepID=A0A8S1P3Z1_9CILI|nr:unnamed protein product [Paramecium sonneborni]